MNPTKKNDIDAYVKTLSQKTLVYFNKNTITLNNLDFYTCAGIANKVAKQVVSDSGEYLPEFTEPLLLLNILTSSANISFPKDKEVDMDWLYVLLNSEFGTEISKHYRTTPWMRRLYSLTKEKIDHRKTVYCNANNLVNYKLSELVDKEMEVQNALLDSTQYMEDLSKNFKPTDISDFISKINDFVELMKNPEISDRFYKTIQMNAQDERIKRADKILKMEAAQNVLSDINGEFNEEK